MHTEDKSILTNAVRGAGALLASTGLVLSLVACGAQPESAATTSAATTANTATTATSPVTIIQQDPVPAPVVEVTDEDLEHHTVTSDSGTTYVDNELIITYGPGQAGDLEAFKQQLSEKFGAEYIGTGDGYNSVLVRFDHTMTLEEIGNLVDQIREAFPGCSAKHRDPTIFA